MSSGLPTTSGRRRAVLSGNLLILLFGVAGLVEGVRIGLWRGTSPGAGLFPAVMCVAVIALCVAALFVHSRDPAGAVDSLADGEAVADSRRLIAYIGALLVYALALEPLGYLVSTAAVFVFLLRFAERVTWARAITITVSVLVVCEVVFARLLAVDLPSGRFF